MGRTIPTTNWTDRLSPGDDCMDIIATSLWDDTKSWQDNKYWWDDGIAGTINTGRTILVTNWE